MEVNKSVLIKCPHCGWEYVPAEILYPENLTGKPTSVVRDALGKIIYVGYEEGQKPDFHEKYICDNCGQQFVVETDLVCKTMKEEEALDFQNQSTSLLD